MERSDREAPVFSHYSVMRSEAIEALRIRPDGIYIDGTAGGGGHSFAIAEGLTDGGRLIAFDQDSDALAAAERRLAPFSGRVTLVHANFRDAGRILFEMGIPKIDGALLDLGVSSFQLDSAEPGFSYMQSAPLDMRMDREQTLSAYDVVNGYDEQELRRILRQYGEEKFAPRIASAIVKAREKAPIRRTGELAELIKEAIRRRQDRADIIPRSAAFRRSGSR